MGKTRWLQVEVIEETSAGTVVCALFDDGAAAGWLLVHPEAIRDCNVILKENERLRREAHVLEELGSIIKNQPLWPGDTISHDTANECVRRGLAKRDCDGYFVVRTPEDEPRSHFRPGDVVLMKDGREERLSHRVDRNLPGDGEHWVRADGTGPCLMRPEVHTILSRRDDQGRDVPTDEGLNRRLPDGVTLDKLDEWIRAAGMNPPEGWLDARVRRALAAAIREAAIRELEPVDE